MENIGRQMKKEPTDIKYLNLLRKGNTDSVKYVEPCDRVHDTWQIVRLGYFIFCALDGTPTRVSGVIES